MALAFALYVIAYCTLYHFRQPAANLAFWVYSKPANKRTEKCLYYGFYPIYFVHQRFFRGMRHNDDREPYYPPAFQW